MLEFLVVKLWVSKQYRISSSSIFCKDVRTLTRPYICIFFSQPLPLQTWPRRGSNRSVVLRSALRGYLHLPGRRRTLCPGCFLFPLSKSTTRDQWRGFGKGRSSIIPKMAIKTNGSVRPAGHRWTRPTKVTKAAVTFWWSLGHKPTMRCMEYQHRIVKHEPKMTILSYEIFDGKCEWIEEHWFAGNHGRVIPNNLGISCWNVLKTLPGRCSWIHCNKHPKYPK
jgi:hypothetical protein